MGAWSFYFLGKLYLYFRGFIRFDFILNLLFLIFLVAPVPARLRSYKAVTAVKHSLGVVLGLLLLWHDSWLPPLWDALAFLAREGMPERAYVYRFVLGFFSLREVAVLMVILTVCILIRNRIRLTPVVILLILIVPLREFGHPKGEVESGLDTFYRSEASRVVRIDKAKTTDPAFDIVILHVCSLSWDDLKGIGLQTDPFFNQFDYLLTAFNSVTSYSNPSAIRLLRANCGQSGHDALYRDAPRDCYLFEALRQQGYETYFTFNHDGTYDNFANQVQTLGHLDAPLKFPDLPIQAYNFDGSPIFDDYVALEKWWAIRQNSPSRGAVVYYNTVSLHDGAHGAKDKKWWKRDRREQYKEFVRKLLGDMTRFFDLVTSSGRNVVVLFVPEHGMALRGNALQVAGLRDIPLPQITTIPVGIKLIGPGYIHDPAGREDISKPTSYLALSTLIKAFLERNPFGSAPIASKDLIEDLPETDFVSENQGIRIMKKGSDYFLYGKEQKWIALPANALL